MKGIGWIIGGFFILSLGALAFWLIRAYNRIEFDFKFSLQDLLSLNLTNLFNKNQREIVFRKDIKISNQNDFDLEFSGLEAKFYYEGELIGQASKDQYVIKRNSVDTVPVDIKIFIKREILNLTENAIFGRNPQVNYTVNGKINNIMIPKIESSFLIEK